MVILLLISLWVLYAMGFVIRASSIYKMRSKDPEGEADRKSSPKAIRGMWLEACGFFFAFLPWPAEHPHWLDMTALSIGALSVLLGIYGAYELGMQWRVQAVVTKHHRLITSGPYALVRNPVYASLLGMLIASGLIVSSPLFTAIGIVICVIGTEIRVREEEKLLSEKFGREFEAYRQRVPAYIPFLR